MEAKKLIAAFAVLALSSSLCFAGHSGTVRFIGKVVEGGCWNVTGTQNITCERNHVVTHYQTNAADVMEMQANNASVSKTFLDADKKLELLSIVYQ